MGVGGGRRPARRVPPFAGGGGATEAVTVSRSSAGERLGLNIRSADGALTAGLERFGGWDLVAINAEEVASMADVKRALQGQMTLRLSFRAPEGDAGEAEAVEDAPPPPPPPPPPTASDADAADTPSDSDGVEIVTVEREAGG
eukprot:gene7903-6463_t